MQALLDRPVKPTFPRPGPPEFRPAAARTTTALGSGGVSIFVFVSGGNPVKYTDPDGRAGQRLDFLKDKFRVDIDIAIRQISSTDFGKSNEGKIIVAKLSEMNDSGRILPADLNKNNHGDNNGVNAIYIKESDLLVIDENLPSFAYAATLAHDGTHKKDSDEGMRYDFYSELRGYANGKKVAVQLGIPYFMPTDEEIEQMYGLKKSEAFYSPTPAEIDEWDALRNEY
jgi:hypothetical protein